jgi:glycosyltransferase involved in cell wall biosynthesis
MMIPASDNSGGQVPLTVAIPAYNRCSAVKALLKSVCEQIGSDDEVIVSDDGSTDGTTEQVSKIPGVKVIRHEKNQGMVTNWNACLAAANRDWICIIHDDDELEPGGLAALKHACALANGPALIQHQYAGNLFDSGFRYTYSDPSPGTVLSCPFIPSGAVLHRAIVKAVGPFNPHYKYSADLEYFPRITAQFPLIVIESPHIVKYRRHGANYHFQAAHQPDFYVQYEELLRSIISYAGITDKKLIREILEGRLVADWLYMLDMADRISDHRLVRQMGRNCNRFRHRLSARQRVMTSIAAITGWRPRRHRADHFEPLSNHLKNP